jgi:UDPglucose 6-dehydrogenase
MRIVMVGAGYVGLVSAACFADFGHEVVCVDSDADKVAALERGEVTILEPGLADLVAANAASGRLRFSTTLAPAVAAAEVVFIAVGTPSRRGDGYADLTYVRTAATEIARAVAGFTVVVTKSTVPIGTGDEIERVIRETNPNADVAIVSNPEFLREGAAIADFRQPDRVVIGLSDDRARAIMAALYQPLTAAGVPVFITARRSAELIKYAANAFLAMKVSFISEIADLCEATDANVLDVAYGIGLDSRIGGKYLRAGAGFGGSCLPKDATALSKTAHDAGRSLRLVEVAVDINERRRRAMGRKVIAACGGDVRNKTIAILGLTFAPNTDDMREAPSLSIIQALQDAGASIAAYDPAGMSAAQALLDNVRFVGDPYAAVENADAVVIVTEWDEFRSLDLNRLRAAMRTPVLVDLRNIYRRRDAEAAGLVYDCVGRPAGVPEAVMERTR